jgi:hypothetical protein
MVLFLFSVAMPIFLRTAILLGLVISLTCCKDPSMSFSTGAADSRIAGSWRLIERRYPKDSIISYVINDTTILRRDTSFYTTRRYPATPLQTLTFNTDGTLSANGSEMTYYYSIRHFNIDATYPDSLALRLYINTNQANIPFRQHIAFRQDTLLILPGCEGYCFLKFLRVHQ